MVRLAREALRIEPLDASADAALGDALFNLGRYREAFNVYDRMALLAPGVASFTRVASARELIGHRAAAATADELALEAGSVIPENDAWATVQLGNVDFNAPLSMSNVGGQGKDGIRVIFGFNPQPDPPAMPPLVGVHAPVTLNVNGGLGGDSIAARVGFNPQPDPPASPIAVNLLGGGGADSVRFDLLPASQGESTFSLQVSDPHRYRGTSLMTVR